MKRILCLLITAVMLAGCLKPAVQLKDGIYAKDGEDPGIDKPYLIINGDQMHYIMNMAVSYQPSGKYEQNGSRIVMKTEYMDLEVILAFDVRDGDTLIYRSSGSVVPEEYFTIEDGTVFEWYEITDN